MKLRASVNSENMEIQGFHRTATCLQRRLSSLTHLDTENRLPELLAHTHTYTHTLSNIFWGVSDRFVMQQPLCGVPGIRVLQSDRRQIHRSIRGGLRNPCRNELQINMVSHTLAPAVSSSQSYLTSFWEAAAAVCLREDLEQSRF